MEVAAGRVGNVFISVLSTQVSSHALDFSSEMSVTGGCPTQICKKKSDLGGNVVIISHFLSSPATEIWRKIKTKLLQETICYDWTVKHLNSIINLYMKIQNICIFIFLASSIEIHFFPLLKCYLFTYAIMTFASESTIAMHCFYCFHYFLLQTYVNKYSMYVTSHAS